MHDYTVLRTLQASVAVVAVVLAGCAGQPAQRSSANLTPEPAPAAQTAPATSGALSGFRGFETETLTPGAAAPVTAGAPVQVRTDAPLRYVVKPGDTLWGIAQRFLVSPWQWPEVWVVNDQVRNPHRIYPGDVLTLIWRDGRPQVEVDETQRLSPRIRETDLDAAIPTIPLDAIRDFLRSPRLVSLEALKDAPYLLDFVDRNILGAAGQGAYARKLTGPATLWEVVQLGRRYVDPETQELLGHEAIPVAEAELRSYGDPGIVHLNRSYREARPGDYLIRPEYDQFIADFHPRLPKATNFTGRIMTVFDGVSHIGQYQIITLNRGRRDGLEPGHVLDILQTGRSAKDPHGTRYLPLPEIHAGRVLVFKAEDRIAYAMVMSATRPVHANDKVVHPHLVVGSP